MNKTFLRALFCALSIFIFSAQTYALDLTVGKYRLVIDESSGKVNIYQGSTQVIKDSQASFKIFQGIAYTIGSGSVSQSTFSDALGSGTKVVYKGTVNGWTIEQNFYLYSSNDYMATDFTVEISSGTLSCNYMAPIKTSTGLSISGTNRVLRVPFDNDDFIRYISNGFGSTTTSYEVTAIYSENTSAHQGLIIGSVTHDTWKTGVKIGTSSSAINSMEVFGGIADGNTRDHYEHRPVKLKKIQSPKIFIGYYSDWRTGMEDFGKANRLITPKYYNWSGSFNGKKPFGWNSWAVLASNINYDNCNQVSEWIKNNIQHTFKSEDNTVYIGLDSYWNESGFSNSTLKQFVDNCHARGQKAGVYLVPFSHWGSSAPSYALKVDGQPKQLDGGWCIDPTHPSTKSRAENEFLSRIKYAGFDYIKVDFLSHGSMEADSWYDTSIQTGIQAYNHGMKWLADWFKSNMPNMYVNLSIAPLFPGQYAHSRRISCDAWADINQSEYALNSLSYGWWLDYVYDYNDADHVRFLGASESENRARYTSSIITGIAILGDDYSNDGNNEIKERTKYLTTNADINQIAYQTKAFRPLRSGSGNGATEVFYQTGGGYTYVAIFNYSGSSKSFTINATELGLSGSYSFPVKELWRGTTSTLNGTWTGTVPSKDCFVLRIESCTDLTDSDGDGVPDCLDWCLGTPLGTLVDEHGCEICDESIDTDKDGVPDCFDVCPNTPLCAKVDATGCPIPPFEGKIIANFEDKQLSSHSGDANIKTKEIKNTPDAPASCSDLKSLYVETNTTLGSGEAQYGSGITLNFPEINTDNGERYLHIFFKTNTEKVEFRINGSWGPAFNPRTAVANNGWFDYVVDLGSGTKLSQFKIMFDMRTGSNCDTSSPFQAGYNNHNKYMYIEDVVVSKVSTPRTAISCGTDECVDDPEDDDGDGVPNVDDLCPNTPAGTPVDASGCPKDKCLENIADFEVGGTNNVTIKATSGTSGLNLDGIISNPSATGNATARAYKISTTGSYNNSIGWEAGIAMTFNSAISADSYLLFAMYTTLEKIEFPGRSNVTVTPGKATVGNSVFNELKLIAKNQWFDVTVPIEEDIPAGTEFVIWIDSRVIAGDHDNKNKVLYIDEIKAKKICTGITLIETSDLTTYVNANKQIVVNIGNSDHSGTDKICVYDISGKKIVEQVVSGAQTVINARLDAGIYLVQLYQGNSVKTAKVLVY